MGTPLKLNLEPENGHLEKEIPFNNYHFPVLCLTLGVYLLSIAWSSQWRTRINFSMTEIRKLPNVVVLEERMIGMFGLFPP